MQAMLFEFLRRGLLDDNLERARALLRERRDALLAALERAPRARAAPRGAGRTAATSSGSTCPTASMRTLVFDRAAEEGVAVVKGTDFFPHGTGGESSLRLAFSFVSAGRAGRGGSRG